MIGESNFPDLLFLKKMTFSQVFDGLAASLTATLFVSRRSAGLIQRMGSPEKVARTSIYLAGAPEAANITGKYFESSTDPKDLRGEVIDYAKQERPWELGTSLVRDDPTSIASNGEFGVLAIAFEPV